MKKKPRQQYPKFLHHKEREGISVANEAEESARRAEGFGSWAEIHGPKPEAPKQEEPPAPEVPQASESEGSQEPQEASEESSEEAKAEEPQASESEESEESQAEESRDGEPA